MARSDISQYLPENCNRISDDQRKVVKDKTGFEGYTAYLEDCTKKNSDYETLLKTWRELEQITKAYRSADCGEIRDCCDILDLIKDEDSLISLTPCCRTVSTSELFTALSEPREGVYGRIMLWRMPKKRSNDTHFLEDLGLLLKIGPPFLNSLFTKCFYEYFGFAHVPISGATHVVVGDKVATMTHCCISEKSSAVPIVFIADTANPFETPSYVLDPKFKESMGGPQWPFGTYEYSKMFMGIIERSSIFTESADALILPALLAAMHMDAFNLLASCRSKFQGYKVQDQFFILDHKVLRQSLEDFEDVTQDAQTSFASLYGADWSQEYGYESTVDYFEQTINRVRRFEANHRDRFQVYIGHLSLEESKKAIELATSQIEEGKQVKIFTVLAFVYVPLNLASSIFGMNIQQLNNSGQTIQTFLVTAVVILLLTGCSWLCIEEVPKYRRWSQKHGPRRPPPQPSRHRPTYSLAVRVRMLVWLVFNGHWTWMCKTKAWRYILANSTIVHGYGSPSESGFRPSKYIHRSDWELSAGEYLSKYMYNPDASRAFALDERDRTQERASRERYRHESSFS